MDLLEGESHGKSNFVSEDVAERTTRIQ